MAPGAVADCSSPDDRSSFGSSPLNVFEGPEKKLVVQFVPDHAAHSSQPCNDSSHRRGLRALRPDHIRKILDAAACTMLSVVSNKTFDAYLLSESSLFVSDFQLTLKTCGTTTLLRALPVILRLVFENLGLEVMFVQFSRVSYLFPGAQRYPHDSFDNEVAYLNHQLATNGIVYETVSLTGSRWYLYYANVGQAASSTWKFTSGILTHCSRDSAGHEEILGCHALELYMFDLDPDVMKRYMFHDRPGMIGPDNVRYGTLSVGIGSLLGDHDVADGFNFEPCGYSMNALSDNAYYTIHISPEPDASYVSFETTADIRSFTALVVSVVNLFRPGRFVASLVSRGRDLAPETRVTSLPWLVLSKLLSSRYSLVCEPSSFGSMEKDDCVATVASFQGLSPIAFDKTASDGWFGQTDIERHLLSVAMEYDAYFTSERELLRTASNDCEASESYEPRIVVNLSSVIQNWTNARKFAPTESLKFRYAVRTNSDTAVLALLKGLDVEFEVCDAYEIDSLAKLGVSRARIILVTPVLTTALMARFHKVGTVALFDVPSPTVESALQKANVNVEVHVVESSLADLDDMLRDVARSSSPVVSIAVDADHDLSESVGRDYKALHSYVENVNRSVRASLPYTPEGVVVHLGELWTDSEVFGSNAKSEGLQAGLRGLPSQACVGIDASQALLAGCVSLVTSVVGRRARQLVKDPATGPPTMAYSYYLTDGAYGALGCVLMAEGKRSKPHAVPIRSQTDQVAMSRLEAKDRSSMEYDESLNGSISTLFGPTCDAIDRVWAGDLPLLNVGDRLVFPNVGVHASTCRTAFNGFARRFAVSYVVSPADV